MGRATTGFAMPDGKKHGPMLQTDHNYEVMICFSFCFLFLFLDEQRAYILLEMQSVEKGRYFKDTSSRWAYLCSVPGRRNEFGRRGLNYVESRIRLSAN